MKRTLVVVVVFFSSLSTALSAAPNVLVVASTRPYFGQPGASSLDEAGIVALVKERLAADKKMQGDINIVFEDVFRTKQLETAVGQKGSIWQTTYRCHSLAQWYFWPEGREDRMANLKGERGMKWDMVAIIEDASLVAMMPGIFAEGAALIIEKVREGTARPVLIVPPAGGANAAAIAEVVCRVGMTADVPVLPPPAAATMKKVSAGAYDAETVFSMKHVDRRSITYDHTGSSSEHGIEAALRTAVGVCGVKAERMDPGKGEGKADFNFGRANSEFEKNKQYKVDPGRFGRSYGFPMQDHSRTAEVTMPYGIDCRGNDGTDLGIAWDMINQLEVEKDVRCVPIRLMYAKLHEAAPDMKPCGDGWHMNKYLNTASATFIYTLLSGRCPIGDRPSPENKDAWNQWLGQMIGYQTAWRMSHVEARAPGFVVRPMGPAELAPDTTAELEVRFICRPTADVAVAVDIDQPQAATVKPKHLTFTPKNFDKPQKVTVKASRKATPTEFRVGLTTRSSDVVFNVLHDSWPYAATGR